MEIRNNLADLALPSAYNGPLLIDGFSKEQLTRWLRMILTIRRVEEKIGDKVISNEIKCPCHLAIGQEAIAVGVSDNLRKTDRVFGAHRSHAHFLALGAKPYKLFAEVLGKATGCSKGMGGSMHLFDEANGFKGSVPIVSGTVSLAVGAGLAAKLDGKKSGKGYDVGVTYFGDGACEEGVVHESLNLAANFKLPVIFVCENNFFSSHLHINQRQPQDAVARFAQAHDVAFELVDGNDSAAVYKATKRLVERARSGEGPGFLEAITYRWRGHVGPSEDTDVGVKRKDDLASWKKRDPMSRLFIAMEQQGMLSHVQFEKMDQEVREEVNTAWIQAVEAPFPGNEALLDLVYEKKGK